MKFWAVGIVGLLAASTTALAQEPLTWGGQFQVNTYTTSQQHKAAVAADAQGDFVVVWGSLGGSGTDLTGWSIQAQRYDATGIAVGGEFQVNSYTTSSQEQPTVAADDLGNFVVAWEGEYQDDPTSKAAGILAQRYDDSGTPVDAEFQVNSYTTNSQIDPSVGFDAAGNFVVVWSSYSPDGSSGSVQAQRYDDSGTPDGSEFQVNSYTTSYQVLPKVAFDEQGDFVVVWQSRGSYGTDNSHWSIQAQRYDDSGTPVDAEFQVNSYFTSHQTNPAVAADAKGNFVVVWQSNGSYGTDQSGYSIQAQCYDTTGAPAGDQVQVNTYTTGAQEEPAVASDAQGNFVVLWDSLGSYGTDSSATSIQGQFFNACGAPVGGQFQVNSYTTDKQESAVVSSLDSWGTFVVAWQSTGSVGDDTSSISVQAQRYLATGIFADGSESGDTSAWSSTVQ